MQFLRTTAPDSATQQTARSLPHNPRTLVTRISASVPPYLRNTLETCRPARPNDSLTSATTAHSCASTHTRPDSRPPDLLGAETAADAQSTARWHPLTREGLALATLRHRAARKRAQQRLQTVQHSPASRTCRAGMMSATSVSRSSFWLSNCSAAVRKNRSGMRGCGGTGGLNVHMPSTESEMAIGLRGGDPCTRSSRDAGATGDSAASNIMPSVAWSTFNTKRCTGTEDAVGGGTAALTPLRCTLTAPTLADTLCAASPPLLPLPATAAGPHGSGAAGSARAATDMSLCAGRSGRFLMVTSAATSRSKRCSSCGLRCGSSSSTGCDCH